MSDNTLNPAEQASEYALDKIRNCLAENKSFLLEAGAGAGKTYSLIQTLKHLIKERGNELVNKHQKIACITYTNVAADEIAARTDDHPAIHSSTIHHFCWSLIKNFQPFLRDRLSENEKWSEKIEEAGGIKNQTVVYDLGYRTIDDKTITLHHDDVLSLMVKILAEPKFQNLFISRYPILFIDEYQDTNTGFADALKTCFLDNNPGLLIGFFGDHWQKIYGTGCGKIEHSNLEKIGKKANFRSVPIIVNALNKMRPELAQDVRDPADTQGAVSVLHTNNWAGTRLTKNHWQEDLPPENAHNYLNNLRERLEGDGWDFAPDKTKILMLTHNILAQEQGYRNLAGVFRYNQSFIKKENNHIAFMVDIVEPVCEAYKAKHFGEMFALLGQRTPLMRSHQDKEKWANDMDALLGLRENGTIGDVINHLRQTKRPRLPENVEDKERRLQEWLADDASEDDRSLSELNDLKAVAYSEIIALTKFLDDSTPFSTKHGVKGAEFENVLVVFGRGWNQYNFNQYLEWAGGTPPPDKTDTFERNRNLFYVACSRPKERLCLLFTQRLNNDAIATLENWFGTDNICAL